MNNEKVSEFPSAKAVLTCISLFLLGGSLGLSGSSLLDKNKVQSATPSNSAEQLPNNSATAAIPPGVSPVSFITDVVKESGPAVVRINASKVVSTELPEVFKDPVFRHFFADSLPQTPEKQIRRGLGSGLIVSSDGLIYTNAHVIEGADKVTVTLKDGRTLQGKVLGGDKVTDVAVVKINANNLPTVKLGNSDRLQTGEWAIAIGNPLGLDNTVTAGIISAIGRHSSEIGEGDKRIDFIQTDAAINPGNSGGPLLNAKGEVIAINTAIIQHAQGLGFAIPINKAKQVADQIITKGKVEHAYLGIYMVAINPELKQQLQEVKEFNIKANKGVLVVRVANNSPSAKAGIKPGDVIQSLANKEVQDPGSIQDLVEKTSVGKEIPVILDRDGQKISLNVKVDSIPSPAN